MEEAVASMDRAIGIVPGDVGYRRSRGLVLFELGRYDDALDDFNRIVDRLDGEELLTALEFRGRSHYHLGALDSALADFDAALELDPDRKSVVALRAALSVASDPERALSEVDHLARLEGDRPYHDLLRASAHRLLGRLEEAARRLDDYTSRAPGDADGWLEAVRLALATDDLEQAAAAAERARVLEPGRSIVHLMDALVAARRGREAAATDGLDRARALGLESTQDRVTEVRVLRALGRAGEAVDVLESILEGQPNLWEGWLEMARCRRALGLDATEAIERARSLAPHHRAAEIDARGD